ncbi:MAG: hypothetical protein J6W04_00735 [Bacteroidales bacterium]|nr:hypothetical protein [Bacteroidales bacterium]
MLTDEERKLRLENFFHFEDDKSEEIEDPWDDDAIIAVAKKILRMKGLNDELDK